MTQSANVEVKFRYNPEGQEVELAVNNEVAATSGKEEFASWASRWADDNGYVKAAEVVPPPAPEPVVEPKPEPVPAPLPVPEIPEPAAVVVTAEPAPAAPAVEVSNPVESVVDKTAEPVVD